MQVISETCYNVVPKLLNEKECEFFEEHYYMYLEIQELQNFFFTGEHLLQS